MGHGAHGTVSARARLRRPAALLCAAGLVALLPGIPASAALPSLTVYAASSTLRTSLHLQPGFALIVRADRRIETVAIGDPRMVAASPVRRGSDVFDVVLQPLADTGTTNMVLWLGDVTTVWNLEIGPTQRTADVVFVVTQPRAGPAPAPPNAHGHAQPPPQPGPAVPPTAPTHTVVPPTSDSPAGTAPAAAAPTSTATSPPASAPAAVLDLRETAGPVSAVFHVSRTRDGIVLRYEITNGADTDLLIRPASVLVRADGRPAAYGMGRDSVDRGRPDVIPRGATEIGLIDVALPSARRIELALSLLPLAPEPSAGATANAPAARAGTAPSKPMPIVLQATFSGLDRLPLTAGP